MKEIFKDIPGWEEKYEISNEGMVWNKLLGRAMSPGLHSGGYLIVTLKHNGIKEQFYIHRLVAFVFIKNPKNKPWVNHRNSNKQDNRVVNLEWCTPTENINHCHQIGTLKPIDGERKNARLKKEDILKIRDLYKNGIMNQYDLAREFKIAQQHVSDIINYKYWKHL